MVNYYYNTVEISDLLKLRYEAVISQTTDWGFFSNLYGYINYVTETKPLDIAITKVMAEKISLYKKLAELNTAVLNELEKTHSNLSKIACSLDIDIVPFSIENGDSLEHYLFEFDRYLFGIAKNIIKKGDSELLNEFIIPHGKNGTDHDNDFDNNWVILKDIYGDIEFSKTLKLKRRQEKIISHQRKVAQWAAFNKLMNFRVAFLAISENKNSDDILNACLPYELDATDSFDIVTIAEQLGALIGSRKSKYLSNPLNKDDFKGYLSLLNNYLSEKICASDGRENPIASLKSIHLISDSLEPKDSIFLVLDGRFEAPVRYDVQNNKGRPTYIKKLYDIAYRFNVPEKMTTYNKPLADNINNGLFKRKVVAEYLKTNSFKSPTIVVKSPSNTMVLNSERVEVKTLLTKEIPTQYQPQYR